eukprot:CAMPEP_0172705736 /NCGR_PEP_ID=MMETSP1074-20121228/44699_1 /TAXON_ID=2916 /ORGANISM="Ceratium fusus, Strain PA161109" /LENGTH=92 /DNA_ID=CAMNT_0013528163 /DNA_START=181 /DNA_END=459 /DNA_ORIENTATION=-
MPHMRPSVRVATLTEDPTSMASGDNAVICAADGASAAVDAPNVDAAIDPAVMKQQTSWMNTKAVTAATEITRGRKPLFDRNAIVTEILQSMP